MHPCNFAIQIYPVFQNVEFPPLSLLSVENGATMPAYNPVDQLVLEKFTPVCRPNAVCSTEQEEVSDGGWRKSLESTVLKKISMPFHLNENN